MTCKVCDKTMRPRGTRQEEYPGTVQAAHRTACRGCVDRGLAERATKPRVSTTLGQPCKTCDAPMCPSRRGRSDVPEGYVEHYGNGVCRRCGQSARARQIRAATALPHPDTVPFVPPGLTDGEATVRRMARDLDEWLRDRRTRGIPHEGTGAHRPSPRKVVAS